MENNKTGNNDVNFVNKSFTFDENQLEYTIKIKKKCKWCWLLLLLLLPLFLLIPLKKDIKFKVINTYNNSVVSGLKVNFAYTKRDLFNFNSFKFFTRNYLYPNSEYQSDTTDANGIAIIKDVKYTVYQWLFRNNDITRTYALSECSHLDTTITLFKLKTENIVYLSPHLNDIEFTVVDASDNNAVLPDALVTIEADMFAYKDSMRSDAGGKVVFKKVSVCANIKVEGYKYGWYKDTISGKFTDHENDTLFLKQEKEIVKFFVKDLYTKKALVGASGSIFFKNNPRTPIQNNIITNTSGIGKGVTDSLHRIKKIRIDVTFPPHYNDSSTVKYHIIKRWKRYKPEKRTIYLRPKPNPIVFKNIDCDTKRPLPNIENEVTIKKSNGKTDKKTKISNINGEFIFSAGIGDKITIISISKNICPNEYLPNKNTVKNIDYSDLKNNAGKRIIPLCKKKATKQKFRNVDADNNTKGIAGVTNKITVDNGVLSFTKISGKDGWFEIDNVYECQKIVIIANGNRVGYGINNTKINPKKYSNIMHPNPQNLRNIPLKLNPIRVKFCDVDKDNGNIISGAVNEIYINGNPAGTKSGGCFEVEALPNDKIKIIGKYKGKVNNTKISGNKTLKQLKNASRNDRNIPFKIDKPIRVKFCDIDQKGNTISGAVNEIYINGNFAGTKSGGCFEVKALPNDKIKIIGKFKNQTNNTKIRGNKTLKQLKNASQNDRNIPFKVEPSLPCNQPVSSGAGTSGPMYFQLGSKSGNITLTYNMQGHPDEITIYCGHGTSGDILYRKTAATTEGSPHIIRYNATKCKGYITITIVPQGENQSSNWLFNITCPL